MSKNSEQKKTLENILKLEGLKSKLEGPDLGKLEEVLDDMRKSVGETISKTNASKTLEVSRQSLERWIKEGLVPVKRGANGREQVPREVLEKLALKVREARNLGKTRAILADSLRDLAEDIAPAKKPAAKKSTAKKPAAKKPAAKKPAAKKGTTKKTTAKKSTAKNK